MAGRIADPNTQYKVYLHTIANKYVYATVQRPYTVDDGTRLKYKPFHLGKVSPDMVFTPNAEFRLLPVGERMKYVFPKGMDISKAVAMNHPEYTLGQHAESVCEASAEDAGGLPSGEEKKTSYPVLPKNPLPQSLARTSWISTTTDCMVPSGFWKRLAGKKASIATCLRPSMATSLRFTR